MTDIVSLDETRDRLIAALRRHKLSVPVSRWFPRAGTRRTTLRLGALDPDEVRRLTGALETAYLVLSQQVDVTIAGVPIVTDDRVPRGILGIVGAETVTLKIDPPD